MMTKGQDIRTYRARSTSTGTSTGWLISAPITLGRDGCSNRLIIDVMDGMM